MPEEQIVSRQLGVGECVLLHNWLMHPSDVNRTDTPWRGLSVCHLDTQSRKLANQESCPTMFGKGALDPDTLEKQAAVLRGFR